MALTPREVQLRRNYIGPNGEYAAPSSTHGVINHPVSVQHILLVAGRSGGRPGRVFACDSLFPHTLEGRVDTASIDEGSADLLYGLVRGLQPMVVLETGTHKGRSTRALAAALWANARTPIMPLTYTTMLPTGRIYTVDAEDHRILTSGAIPEAQRELVQVITGWTPDVFTQEPLDSLQGIEFAFLDGDHTADGIEHELLYVDAHRAPECWVAIDNSRDAGWPEMQQFLRTYTKYPRITLSTCTGLDLIWMHDPPAPVSGRNGATP